MTPRTPGPMFTAPVAPVTTTVQVTQVRTADGREWVMLQFATATGVSVYFIEPEAAEELAIGMGTLARAAKAGIVIPAPKS